MDELPPPLKKPLVFGDTSQINAIKDIEREQQKKEEMCQECTGEGMITCWSCQGSGVRKK